MSLGARTVDSTRLVAFSDALAHTITRPLTVMEVCGGQTHTLVKAGLLDALPPLLTVVHGPGCPVCVTPIEVIDRAIALALTPGVTLATFGDMLRVPGTTSDLSRARASGGSVRVIYSPLDVLALAEHEPTREFVLFAVGFETTAPAHALVVEQAARRGLKNVSLLVAHVLVPPALEAILTRDDNTVQGFLAAGHVCTIMGTHEYTPIAEKYAVPIVVTGFEPEDLMEGLWWLVRALEEGRNGVENQYVRAVRDDGNASARALMSQVFTVVERRWRGLGDIAQSGLALAPAYARFDAEARFGVVELGARSDTECRAGDVLVGRLRPDACPAFGTRCTPERPLGAPMVSSEGACAAYFRYRRRSA
jgi:hydrogenase expression/formation protein HypD